MSHPKVLATLMGLAEISRTPNGHISIRKFQGTFSLRYKCDNVNLARILGNFNAHSNIIGVYKHIHPKKLGDEIVRSLSDLNTYPA